MSDRWLPPAAPAYEPPPPAPAPEPPREHWLRRLFGPLLVAGALLLKFGKAAILLLTKGKFFGTALSMLISIGVYAVFWGWPFAVGIVALLLIHECGHALQMKREGIEVGGMAFIPFLGAAVWSKELERDALAEARVGLAGPVIGSLAAAAALPLYAVTDDEFWRALAYFGFFINLFNLIPVTPFDGGRAFAAMAPWMWFVGLAMMAALLVVRPNPFVILFLVLGVLDVSRRWKARHEQREYYRVKTGHRLAVGAVYVSLAVALVAGMNATYIDPDTLD